MQALGVRLNASPPRALNGCAGERRRGEDVAAFVFEVIHNTVNRSIIAGSDGY